MITKVPLGKDAVVGTARTLVRVMALCFALCFVSMFASAQLQLLKDVNTREDPYHSEFSYPVFTKAGSLFYFVSNKELWRSDGTLAGTFSIKTFRDINSLTPIGTEVYFAADDGASGLEVWRSNGTVAGTVLVKDVYAGATGSSPANFTNVNGVVYFTARNASAGRELWKTNGTAAGTVLIKDIIRGSGSSNPGHLCALNNTLLFVANDGQIGYELWKTDGTAAGTFVVKDIRPAYRVSSLPQHLTNVNGTVYFSAIEDTGGRELWKTNGTTTGTALVKDIRVGATGSNVENLVNLNGTLIFTADDGVHGDELWKSNGTEAGTVLVKDMNPGPEGSNNTYDEGSGSPQMSNFTIVNGLLYFTAAKGYTNYIYRTDGSEAGTVIIMETPWSDFGGSLYPFPHFSYMNGNVYFFSHQWIATEYWYELTLFSMPYNGTSPTAIKGFAGYNAQGMISHNNMLFMAVRTDSQRGYMIARSDGTAAGTAEFIDPFIATMGSNAHSMFNHGSFVYFRTEVRGYYGGGQEVWRTNGTTAGTVKLGTTNTEYPWVASGSYVYFVSFNSEARTWQLWRTNSAGTVMIKQGVVDPTNPGNWDWTRPREMVHVSGKLYYSTASGELWRYDPSTNAFKLLKTFRRIKNLYGANGRAYVVAADGSISSLYRADATGAYFIEHLNTGTPEQVSAHYPSVVYGNIFYFVTQDNTHGNEIWRTDGTASGTYMVQDMSTSDVVYWDKEWSVRTMFIHNSQLYATGIDNERDTYLWKFNGTVFEKVKEIYDVNLVSHNGLIYIWGRDVTTWRGYLLQVTDGTAEGFRVLASLPEHTNDDRVDFGIVGSNIYFNRPHEDGIWRTDGTECGTFFKKTGVYTYEMQGLNTSLIFAGNTPTSGIELYIYRNINSYITDNCGDAMVAMTAAADKQSVMTAHPNPYTDKFTLRIGGNENELADVAIYSSTGMPIETFKGVKTNTDYEHIGASWPPGMYIMKVNVNGKLENYTVIKR